MAKPELLSAISSLNKRVDILLQQQKKLQQHIKNLEKENEELKYQNLNFNNKIKQTEKEVEFLTLSHRLANSPEALIQARLKISGLIRTIDNCIRLIKED